MTTRPAPTHDNVGRSVTHRGGGRPARARSTARVLAAAGLTAALLASAACSSSGSTSASGSGSGSTGDASTGNTAAQGGSAAASAELAQALKPTTTYAALKTIPGGVTALKGKTVWFVPISASLPYMGSVGAGVRDALKMVGANLHTCDGKLLPTAMASCMDDAAAQHAAAVIGGYIDYKLIPNAFDNLVAKHIPVLVGGAPADSGKPSSPQLAFYDLLVGQNAVARLMAEKVIADSSGKAKILYVGSKDTPELASIAAYAKAYYKQHCPGCSFTEIDYLTSAANKLGSQVSAALISHPDTDYVVMQFDPYAAAVANAIQTAGKTSSVKLYAEGGGLDSLQRVASGRNQVVDVGTSGYYTGWLFVDGVARMLSGSIPLTTQAINRVFTKDNVKTLSLTPEAYASNAWYGDESYRKVFATAWGITG